MVFRLTPEHAVSGRKEEIEPMRKNVPRAFFRKPDSGRASFRNLEGKSFSPHRQAAGGFSILEAVIAIALIGSALIISSAFLNTLIVSADHLSAQIELLHEIEGSLEMMRAGHIPLETGSISLTGSSSARLPGLVVTVLVEPGQRSGLYRVTFRAECSFRRRRLSRSLISEIWSP